MKDPCFIVYSPPTKTLTNTMLISDTIVILDPRVSIKNAREPRLSHKYKALFKKILSHRRLIPVQTRVVTRREVVSGFCETKDWIQSFYKEQYN